jgi:hypothetical protein
MGLLMINAMGVRGSQSEDNDVEGNPDAEVDDKIERFFMPAIVREISPEVNIRARNLQERIKGIFAASGEKLNVYDDEQVRMYVETRKQFLNDAATCFKAGRLVLRNCKQQGMRHSIVESAFNRLVQSDDAIRSERAFLAAHQSRLQRHILSHSEHNQVRLGEAYLTAIKYLAEVLHQRDDLNRKRFRMRVYRSYHPPEWVIDQADEGWCPVMKEKVPMENLIATWMVPQAIGGANAGYVFGLDAEQGYEAIWSAKNGLPLSRPVQEAFRASQIVIIADQNEFKLVVLEKSILDKRVSPTLCWRDLDNVRLEFLTDARPEPRFLFFHYRTTLLRRRNRLDSEEWKHARDKAVWNNSGRWLRESMMIALASEIGR